MKFHFGLFILLFMMTFSLAGCGDLFKKKVSDKPMESSRFKVSCKLNMDELAKILDKDISGTLDCLGKNLNVFIKISELGKGGKLSRVALINFLRNNRSDISADTYKIIDTLFSVNHLITGEDPDFISKENMDKIISFAITFNYHAYKNFSYTFGSKLPANLAIHESHKRQIIKAGEAIQKSLLNIYVPESKDERVLDIMKLIGSLLPENDHETLEKIEGILFVKKIITGGEPHKITHKETGYLIRHLPGMFGILLDGIRYQYLNLDQLSLLKLVQKDVTDLSDIVFNRTRPDRRTENLFHLDEAIDGIDRFLNKDAEGSIQLEKFRALIHEAKRILTNRVPGNLNTADTEEKNWVTGLDLEKILAHINAVSSKGLAFHQFYDLPEIQKQLQLPYSISLDAKDYEHLFPQQKAELADFVRIVNNYRFMRGTNEVAFYTVEYHRNRQAVVEISIYEYLIRMGFRYYGSALSMSVEQLRALTKKFENELIEMDLILPRRHRNTAETIALLGSLFQYQSDDNKVLDVAEATEFAISLVTSLNIKGKLFERIKSNCSYDSFGRIEPGCFKNNFFEALCVLHRDRFPKLFEYMGAGPGCKQDFNSSHNLDYFEASAKAARFCHVYPDDKREIEYSESDVMAILLAMMHIETTILRWDTLQVNNLMDPNEVERAYAIYKPAILGMLPKETEKLPPKVLEWLAKRVYLYLVKYEEAPLQSMTGKNIAKLIKFLVSFNKKAPATRKTIASILWVVSEQSKIQAEAEGEPQFDCNWLRNPNNIPREE
jgi:hypothetical protein